MFPATSEFCSPCSYGLGSLLCPVCPHLIFVSCCQSPVDVSLSSMCSYLPTWFVCLYSSSCFLSQSRLYVCLPFYQCQVHISVCYSLPLLTTSCLVCVSSVLLYSPSVPSPPPIRSASPSVFCFVLLYGVRVSIHLFAS